jgi:hypothetical protein
LAFRTPGGGAGQGGFFLARTLDASISYWNGIALACGDRAGVGARQGALFQYPQEAVLPLKDGIAATLWELDQRSVAGEGRRRANVNRVLPHTRDL